MYAYFCSHSMFHEQTNEANQGILNSQFLQAAYRSNKKKQLTANMKGIPKYIYSNMAIWC